MREINKLSISQKSQNKKLYKSDKKSFKEEKTI
jgi:hypothetical protein